MKTICTILLACVLCPVMATVKLPSVVSDNMMLQRDAPALIWGWADKGESVTLTFNGQTVKTKAGKDGVWQVQLKAMPYGGPYDMIIKGKSNTITLTNILLGDIWVCSGQSNMEWILLNVNNGKEEIQHSDYPNIRLLQIGKAVSATPLNDAVSNGWEVCSPKSSDDFSAVGYFFGRALYKELNIPIGLINTSWGGTDIETWTSAPAITPYYDDKAKLEKLKDLSFQESLASGKSIDFVKIAETEAGNIEKWYLPETKLSDWKQVKVPAEWTAYGIQGDGIAWYRKEFTLTAEEAQSAVTISFGKIDDWDETYLNGKLVGRSNSFGIDRQYIACPDGLKAGTNVLVIKVTDTGGGGGLYSPAEAIYCQTNSAKIPLSGEWKFKPSVIIAGDRNTGPNDYPSLLYNAMIAPLAKFPVKGAIWYQGENNAGRAYQYRTLFPTMITDWRNAWNQPGMPFYFVQLANYMAPSAQPENSAWAELREAQHLTLNLPNTGEAVIIDIGEEKDIHPRNKQDVGYRLALNALAKTYGKSVEYSGPEYESMQVVGNAIQLTFTHIGKELVVKDNYGYLKGFAIAGADQKFVWAKARIQGNKVIVRSSEVKQPVAVRYAWGNNPDGNLYNSEGLPASPFRTDKWKLTTEK